MDKEVSVSVASNVYDAANGILLFAAAMKKALADGWQPSEDLPAMLSEALKDFVPAFQKVPAALDEMKNEPKSALMAVLLASASLYDLIKG